MVSTANKILSELPDDIKFKYLTFYSEFRQTGITAYRNNHYSLNNLKIDVKKNMEISFNIDDNKFEDLWENYIDIFRKFELDLFETLAYEKLSISLISKYMLSLENHLNHLIISMPKNHKKALFLYLDLFYTKEIYLFDANKFNRLYKLVFGELLSDSINHILIQSGFASESLWISSKGNDLGLHLNKLPFPIDMITKLKNSAFSDIIYPSSKKAFKTFKKRFTYKKTRSYFTECIGIDLLFSGFDQIEKALDLIEPKGITGFLAHPLIIEKDIFNPFVKEELWEFVLQSAKYLQSNYNWVNKIFDNLSNFSFLEESNDFYQIYNHEINNQQYRVIISSWYRYSLPIEQNSILILLYHPNVGSLINNIYDSEKITCIIAFDENEDINLIGEESKKNIVNSIENAFKEKGYSIKKKTLSKEEINEKEHHPIDVEPDILKKILDLLEKHDSEVNEKLSNINTQLQEKLGSDYQKLKHAHQKFKNNEISRKRYLATLGKIIGKHTLSIVGIFF